MVSWVSAEQARPNVIVILADDLGYETIGANGGTSYRTPVLDRLAAEGVRFEQGYAQPLCTPTRAQLLTGASNIRNYTTFGSLDPKLTTFGNLFEQAGYKTGIGGKWQLGREQDLPRRMGFQEACLWQHTRRPPRYANPGLEYDGVEKDFHQGEYGPDLVEAFAEDFIARHAKEPFFLYYPMMLTHSPYQPTPDSADWDPKAEGERVNQSAQHFGEMVEYMDKLVGRLLAKLEECGVRDNTLVIFLGDNGTGRGTRSRMGERVIIGGKGTTTQAGMHVPLLVDWPARVRRGSVCEDLVDTTDILPTILEAAGIAPPTGLVLDGRSFLPQLEGKKGQPRPWIYSWYSPHGEPPAEFAFDARFKRYRDGRFFDLAQDPGEDHPLEVSSLTGDAAAAARRFQEAFEHFRNARPAELRAPIQKPTRPGKGQRKRRQSADS
jgi:arylsulfatase A